MTNQQKSFKFEIDAAFPSATYYIEVTGQSPTEIKHTHGTRTIVDILFYGEKILIKDVGIISDNTTAIDTPVEFEKTFRENFWDILA